MYGNQLISLPQVLCAILFTVSAAAIQSPAMADDADDADESTILIEEFFLIESVYPQERGETQLTLGIGESQDSPEEEGQWAQIGVEYGLTDRLQVEGGIVFWRDLEVFDDEAGAQRHSGIGDLELGLKYSLAPSDGIDVAFGIELTLPTGDSDRELGEDAWVYEPFVILGADLGAASHLTLSFAYGIVDPRSTAEDEEEASENEFEIGVGIVRAFGPAWRASLELSAESEDLGESWSESESFLTPGLIYKGVDDMEFGLGLAIGLTRESADQMVLGSFNIEF